MSEEKQESKQEDDSAKAEDSPGSEEPSGDSKAAPLPNSTGASPESPDAKDDKGGLSKRRTLWRACLDTFLYVNNISQDEAVKVRDSDRATSIWLMIVSIVTVVAMLIEPLAPHRMPFLVVCDILIGMSIFYYIGNRFGIVGTFNPRQALLAWQLMMGAAFFGIFITINLALLLGVAVVVTTPSQIPNL